MLSSFVRRTILYNSRYVIPCMNRRLQHDASSESGVRVRFAPSPTGQLHLGGLRTALYNYMFARSQNGRFILRIEDTDQTRLIPGATEKLIDMLQWSGIQLDEGPEVGGEFGPYCQSQRLHHYQEMIQLLIQLKNLNEPWQDMNFGPITHNVAEIEGDPILMKSDGFPTYHFANVVDDRLMKITHVLRGVEWQMSTTKHVLLYKAFGWDPPKFAHLPLLLNLDGSKLSKRQDDLHVEALREKGFFPEAVVNLLCPTGLLFGKAETTGLTIPELSEKFNMTNMGVSSTKLDLTQLEQLNQVHLLRKMEDPSQRKQLLKQVKEKYKERLPGVEDGTLEMVSDDVMEKHLIWASTISRRISKVDDLFGVNYVFLWIIASESTFHNMKSISETLTLPEIVGETASIIRVVEENEFTEDKLAALFKTFAKERKLKFPKYMGFLRIVLSGQKDGPPVAEMMSILGKQESEHRLESARSHLKTQRIAGMVEN